MPDIYLLNLNLVITVPADGLAPKGARPSAGKVLTTKCMHDFPNILWLLIICIHFHLSDYITGDQDITRCYRTSRVMTLLQTIRPRLDPITHDFDANLSVSLLTRLMAFHHL